MTMEKVAQMAGISRAAVSYVLKDCWREKGISEETYRRIMEVVRKTHYRPNRVATSLANRKTKVIGVQVQTFQYEYNLSLVRSLDKAARGYGYHILLAAPAAWQDEGDELTRLYEHQVDGLILNPQVPAKVEAVLKQLKEENAAIVFFGNVQEGSEYFVMDDNVGQGELAVEHLIGLGHRRIAHISGPTGNREAEQRKQGYLQAMKKHDLMVPAEYVELGSYEIEWAKASALRLMKLSEPPTAVYCANDPMAIASIEAIESVGRRVPEDVSIVGHGDDIPFSSFTRIPLTTIAQQPEVTAKLAMKMIIDLVEGRTVEQKEHILPGTLIVRNSSGPCRK